jgi:hypothetical protein
VWGWFLRSLGEGIAVAAVVATSPTITTAGDAVVREKDRMSYRTLFQYLEGCSSYVWDVGYRTTDGGWLVKSILNSLPHGVLSDLLTRTTTGIERGGGSGTRSTADNNNCKHNHKCGDNNKDNCGGLLLLFMWERNLLPATPAMIDVGIVCPCASSGLPPSSSPMLSSSSC